MRARGYPVDDDFDRRADDLSVDHPRVVQHYREARQVRDASGEVDTERQRTAVTSYRSLIDALLGDERHRGHRTPAGDTTSAHDTPRRPSTPTPARGPARRPARRRRDRPRRRHIRRPARPAPRRIRGSRPRRHERGPEPPDRGAHAMTTSEPRTPHDDTPREHRRLGQRILDAVLGDPADTRRDDPADPRRGDDPDRAEGRTGAEGFAGDGPRGDYSSYEQAMRDPRRRRDRPGRPGSAAPGTPPRRRIRPRRRRGPGRARRPGRRRPRRRRRTDDAGRGPGRYADRNDAAATPATRMRRPARGQTGTRPRSATPGYDQPGPATPRRPRRTTFAVRAPAPPATTATWSRPATTRTGTPATTRTPPARR